MVAVRDLEVGMASASHIHLQQRRLDQTTLRMRICDEVRRQCLHQYPHTLRGLLLTGSMARYEASVTTGGDGKCHVLGDVEFLIVLQQDAHLPSSQEIAQLQTGIEVNLSMAGVICRVSLSPVHRDYLRKLPQHIFTYELLKCGQVVWGDGALLSLVPEFSPSDISQEDAFRLLCNRMVEQLEMASKVRLFVDALPASLGYSTVKLYLDMATSLLVFVGCYEATYQKRAERLAALDASSLGPPFELPDFSRRVATCTVKKLSLHVDHSDLDWAFFEAGIHYACLLWRWELERLTGTVAQESNRQLLERWRKLQPAHQRLRGWAYVARRQGWLRSWRCWPHWALRAWRGSPRYWIYAAAAEVFFRLPCILNSQKPPLRVGTDWARLQRSLPLVNELAVKHPEWDHVSTQIAWNYHQFLTGTRA